MQIPQWRVTCFSKSIPLMKSGRLKRRQGNVSPQHLGHSLYLHLLYDIFILVKGRVLVRISGIYSKLHDVALVLFNVYS